MAEEMVSTSFIVKLETFGYYQQRRDLYAAIGHQTYRGTAWIKAINAFDLMSFAVADCLSCPGLKH